VAPPNLFYRPPHPRPLSLKGRGEKEPEDAAVHPSLALGLGKSIEHEIAGEAYLSLALGLGKNPYRVAAFAVVS
jgi:hypothetical protein